MKKKRKSPYPRHRGELVTVDPLSYTTTTIQVRKNASTLTTTSSGMVVYTGQNGHDMDDIVTPSYREVSAAGGFVNSPCYKRRRTTEVIPCSATSYIRQNVQANPPNGTVMTETQSFTLWAPDKGIFPPIEYPDRDALRQQAINECFANAHQRDVMGFVDLAEMDKTVAMLSTNIGRLDKVIAGSLFKGKLGKRKYRRGKSDDYVQKYKPRTPAGVAADAAGLWLEVQYGVIPLMLSIEGLIKALHEEKPTSNNERINPITGKARIQTFRGSESIILSDDETSVSVYTDPTTGATYKTELVHSVDGNWKARAGLITSYTPDLKARLGLEGRDLVPGAYELIKFSFVIDWFYDLGTYLEAVTPVKGFSSKSTWSTLILEEIHTYRYVRTGGTAIGSVTRMNYGSYEAAYVERLYDYIRIPGGHPRLPKLDLQFKSYTHLISAAALAFSKASTKTRARL